MMPHGRISLKEKKRTMQKKSEAVKYRELSTGEGENCLSTQWTYVERDVGTLGLSRIYHPVADSAPPMLGKRSHAQQTKLCLLPTLRRPRSR